MSMSKQTGKSNTAKLKFVSTVSKMGEGNKVIYVPRRYLDRIKEFEGKQIRVIIDDEL